MALIHSTLVQNAAMAKTLEQGFLRVCGEVCEDQDADFATAAMLSALTHVAVAAIALRPVSERRRFLDMMVQQIEMALQKLNQ